MNKEANRPFLAEALFPDQELLLDQVMAFVAPKLIGGITAPTPVGELGFVEMTQAMTLSDVSYETVRTT